jgi:urease accessory protein
MPALDGHLSVRAADRGGRSVLAEQSFSAPFHLSKPYWDVESATLLVQAVNPTAGILSGDRLRLDLAVDGAAAMLVTTPSASRVFRMRGGGAVSEQRLSVAPGGWLEVLPEPLVPHAGSCFHQRTLLEVAAGGAAFYADLLVPGRIAHGEIWAWERLVLEVDVRHSGRLVLRERIDSSADELRRLAELAGFSAACFGNAVFIPAVFQSAPRWLGELRALQAGDVWVGASELAGGAGWCVKFVTADSIQLRRTLGALRRLLSAGAPHLACDPRKL